MKNSVKNLLALVLCMLAFSCAPDVVPGPAAGDGHGNDGAGDTSGSGEDSNGTGGSNGNGSGEDNKDNNQQESMTVNIIIGDKVFKADIEDSETGRAFVAKLLLTLDMNELNGNEKYCYGISLPRADKRYDAVAAGDIMLYSGNCIVLFYGPAGGYSYTRIGRLQSAAGLAAALGSGTVTVVFRA